MPRRRLGLEVVGVRAGLAAGALALGVTLGALIVIETLVERRAFVLGDQYLAFLIGDVFLAAVVAIGWWGADPSWSWWMGGPAAIGVVVGVLQGIGEVRDGIYTRAQALSPSHLWHQVVTYPVMAVLLTWAVVLSWSSWRRLAVMVVLFGVWVGLLVWDAHHPKTPHIDFRWSAASPQAVAEGKGGAGDGSVEQHGVPGVETFRRDP